jgi:hypothetical protein
MGGIIAEMEIFADLKNFWWHRHLAGAVHRLEACATGPFMLCG